MRVMANEFIAGQSLPRAVMQNGFTNVKGLTNIAMYRPFNLVNATIAQPPPLSSPKDLSNEEMMLIEECDDMFECRLKQIERFDTLKELETRIRSYTKEAGFGLILMQLKEKDKQNFRVAKCSKGVSKKQMQEQQSNQQSTSTYDDELQIVDPQNETFCPFQVDIQKSERDQKWYVVRANQYHNHPLRRIGKFQGNQFNQRDGDENLSIGQSWKYSKHFGLTHKFSGYT